MGKSLAELNVIIAAKVKGFEDGLKSVERSIKKFQRSVNDTGRTLTTNLSLPILGLGAAAVKAFADFDSLDRGMTAIMGSSEAAAAEFRKLQEAAKLPGLGFEEAVKGSIQLQAIGLSADKARATLMGFGAAIAATGGGAEQLGSVQKQLTQMISKNRILQEDFGIIQENVPLVGKALKIAFGDKTIDQIRATGISAEAFNDKLVEALNTMPEVQNATGGIGNAMENLGMSIKQAMVRFGSMISETFNLQEVFERLGDKVTAVVDWFESLSPKVRRNIVIFAALVAAVGPVLLIFGKIIGVGGMMASTFGKIVGAVKKLGGKLIWLTTPMGASALAATATVAAVAALGAAALYVWKNWEAFSARFQNMWVKIENSVKFAIVNVLSQLQKLQEFLGIDLFDFSKISAEKLMPGDLVDEPAFKTFGATVKEIGDDLLKLTGLKGSVKPPSAATPSAGGAMSVDTDPVVMPVIVDPKLADKMKERYEEVQRMAGGLEPIAVNPLGKVDELKTAIDLLKEAREGMASVKEQLEGVQSVEAFDRLNGQLREYEETITKLGPLTEGTMEQVRESMSVMVEVGEIIKSGFADAISGVGAAMGGMLAGAQTIGDAAKAFVLPLLGVLEQVGKLAISAGMAMIAIKKTLNFGNPFAAIAAGVAMIALANFVKSKISSSVPKMAKGGILKGRTLFEGGEYPGAQSNPEVVAPLDKLSGMLRNIIEPMMATKSMAMQSIAPLVPGLLQMQPVDQQPIKLAPSEYILRGRTLVQLLEQEEFYTRRQR